MDDTQRRTRILVVDDEELNRNLMCEMLRAMWHECETASDGLDALSKLDASFDVVLLDAMMPAMDGFEVARHIRARDDVRNIPIIMVTGVATRDQRMRAVEAGVNGFIAKPAHWTELRVAIETAVIPASQSQSLH